MGVTAKEGNVCGKCASVMADHDRRGWSRETGSVIRMGTNLKFDITFAFFAVGALAGLWHLLNDIRFLQKGRIGDSCHYFCNLVQSSLLIYYLKREITLFPFHIEPENVRILSHAKELASNLGSMLALEEEWPNIHTIVELVKMSIKALPQHLSMQARPIQADCLI